MSVARDACDAGRRFIGAHRSFQPRAAAPLQATLVAASAVGWRARRACRCLVSPSRPFVRRCMSGVAPPIDGTDCCDTPVATTSSITRVCPSVTSATRQIHGRVLHRLGDRGVSPCSPPHRTLRSRLSPYRRRLGLCASFCAHLHLCDSRIGSCGCRSPAAPSWGVSIQARQVARLGGRARGLRHLGQNSDTFARGRGARLRRARVRLPRGA